VLWDGRNELVALEVNLGLGLQLLGTVGPGWTPAVEQLLEWCVLARPGCSRGCVLARPQALKKKSHFGYPLTCSWSTPETEEGLKVCCFRLADCLRTDDI
jgi:hypothetical protein